jgi:outer membrane lipoprotein-sorting protein
MRRAGPGASNLLVKRFSHAWVASLAFCFGAVSVNGSAQGKPEVAVAHSAPPKQEPGSKTEPDAKALERVLAQMDTAAANFRSAQANFVWQQYTKVVDEKEDQKGTIYYRRQGKEIQMMADLSDPKKSVLFRDGKVQVAQPNLEVRTYEAGKNRETVESFLVLGFGGSGQDLLKQFDVKYLGTETIDGVKTAKLELIPKTEKVRKVFGKIWLWIDPARGISLQQQFFEDSGNYRLAKYTEIQVNQKISDNVFKLPNYSDSKHSSGPKS